MTTAGHVVFSQMDDVYFGKPAREALTEIVERLGSQRAFIVASHTLNNETDEIEKLRSALGDRYAGTCDQIPAHTPRPAVTAAADMARAADVDLIISVGGGSITDGAKALQLCLANDISSPAEIGSLLPTPAVAPTVPQVAIPTTLSAAEFTPISGVTNPESNSKDLIRHPGIIPRSVVLDPAMTVYTPEWLWTSTGVRAIDHCTEGVCSNLANPYGDAQGLRGLSLLSSGLQRSHADPTDLEARYDCQMGAWLSTGPFSSGVPMGASHGIGYVLGALFDVPHGHTSCVMLPATMRWNKSVNADRQELVAAALGRPGEDAGDLLDELIGGLGLPTRLSEVDVSPEHFDKIAEMSMSTPWVPFNPKPIPGPEQVREILDLAK